LKVAFVTNFCPHYRVKTFETLARHQEMDYLFFSKGDEWYWPQPHGVSQGAFHLEYLNHTLLAVPEQGELVEGKHGLASISQSRGLWPNIRQSKVDDSSGR